MRCTLWHQFLNYRFVYLSACFYQLFFFILSSYLSAWLFASPPTFLFIVWLIPFLATLPACAWIPKACDVPWSPEQWQTSQELKLTAMESMGHLPWQLKIWHCHNWLLNCQKTKRGSNKGCKRRRRRKMSHNPKQKKDSFSDSSYLVVLTENNWVHMYKCHPPTLLMIWLAAWSKCLIGLR